MGSSYYLMHPGLPGLLFSEFERRYPGEHGQKLRGALITLVSAICAVFYRHGDSRDAGAYEVQRQTLSLIEPTIRRTLDSAIVAERWSDVRNLCAALRLLLTQQGRRLEWRQLATLIRSHVFDDANGNPLPDREGLSYFMQRDHIEDLLRIHSLTDAEWLQTSLLSEARKEHKQLEAESAAEFAKQVLIPALCSLGDIRNEQHETDAVSYYREALRIAQSVHSVPDEQRICVELAALHISHRNPDWKEVTYWFTYASEVYSVDDRNCLARIRILAGSIAMAKSQFKEAINHFQFTLSGLLPADPSDGRADCELKLAEALSKNHATLSESMQRAQSAIAWYDQDQNVYRASSARLVASRILSDSGANHNAFVYAEEAAHGFATLAPHAEGEASEAALLATQWRSASDDGDSLTS
jgi:tetratricopeptide (TPR) repeat protein